MRIVFRADASLVIGSGHVMRCLTLAEALRNRGATVSFVCREHKGHLCDLIEERGIAVSRLPVTTSADMKDSSATAASLGAPWEEDAKQTLAAIEAFESMPDWLVADHYAIDRCWESRLRTSVKRIMVIDDLADRSHDCDLLLDQNLVAQMHTRYSGKVPEACGLVLGPENALLQTIYADLHDRLPPRGGAVKRIFIFFSGADNENLTGRTLDALLQLNRPGIEIDVVVNAGSPHAEALRRQAAEHANVHLHNDLPTLAPMMAAADLAIGAGGATSWERLCLGLPALVVTLSENQRPIAAELQKRGLIRWLGHRDQADELTIAETLDEILRQDLNPAWSIRCRAVVDGHGTRRVCAALITTATSPLCVRFATLEDEALLLTWANDSTTRANAFSPEPIPEATHRAWFRNRLRNLDGCRLYIVETVDGVPIGQVRLELEGAEWTLDYALAQAFRGRGLGRRILEEVLLKFCGEIAGATIVGQVKRDNCQSKKIFESLGFEVRQNERPDAITYWSSSGAERSATKTTTRSNSTDRSMGNRRPKLLLTGGGGAGTEALNRLLQARYEVHFADADNDGRPPSIAAHHWHQIPFASSPDFIVAMRRLCGEIGVDLLIPGVDEELLSIAQARDSMGCEILLPSAVYIDTHLDKLTSNAVLQRHGLPAPQTETLSEHRQISFPCIVKPRQGRGSRGVAIVHSEQELQAHMVISRRPPKEFIVQELLVGQEYTVMMAADRTGRLCAVVPVKVGVKRGITLRAQTDQDEQVIAACAAIHAAQPTVGCYNIQLVKTSSGEVKPFEINPRISTTACLGLAAGVDFIEIHLGGEKNKDFGPGGLLPFQAGLGLKRSWHNEFVGGV